MSILIDGFIIAVTVYKYLFTICILCDAQKRATHAAHKSEMALDSSVDMPINYEF